MYERLLKLEAHELARKPAVSWERIMEIRHLKDRMIRKCQKIAKTSQPNARIAGASDTFVFQTFVAPADFRVKEMEKWFREQQRRTITAAANASRRLPAAIQSSRSTYEVTPAGPSRQVHSKHSMQRSITNPERTSQVLSYKPMQVIQPSRLVQSERNGVSSPVGVFSPPPLPVILLSERNSYGLDPGSSTSLAAAAEQLRLDPVVPSPIASPIQHSSSPLPAEMIPSPPVPDTPTLSLRPSLSRRNSALKRNSMELKTVSWADDGGVDLDGQFRKYASAAREAQASGAFLLLALYILEAYKPSSASSFSNRGSDEYFHYRQV